MTFELFIALRYLRSKRKGLFTMVTTLIGVAGVTIGIAALLVILSVMNGFQADIQRKIVGAQAHITIYARMDPQKRATLDRALAAHNALAGRPEITATAPFVVGQSIISYGERSTGLVLKGIDLDAEFKVNDLAEKLTVGSWSGVRDGFPADAASKDRRPGIVLGEELGRSLGVWVGEDVILVSPNSMGLAPALKKFRVAGLLRTGYYEYDSGTAYTTMDAAAAYFKTPGGISGMQVRLSELELAAPAAEMLEAALGYEFTVRSFTQMNRTLFAALKLEKYVMFIIVTLIVLVASFNIASNLILLGTEKLRDIGLLKAMGAGRRQILRIFLWVGALIGCSGVLLGIAAGLGICAFLHRYPIIELPADIYYLSRLPVEVQPGDVAGIAFCGIALSILATLYPAYQASKADPVEAIHYG